MSPAMEKVEREFKKLAPREQAEVFERFAKMMYGEDDEDPDFMATLRMKAAPSIGLEVARPRRR